MKQSVILGRESGCTSRRWRYILIFNNPIKQKDGVAPVLLPKPAFGFQGIAELCTEFDVTAIITQMVVKYLSFSTKERHSRSKEWRFLIFITGVLWTKWELCPKKSRGHQRHVSVTTHPIKTKAFCIPWESYQKAIQFSRRGSLLNAPGRIRFHFLW